MLSPHPVDQPDLSNLSLLVTGAGSGPGAALVALLVARRALVFAGFAGAADMDLLKGAVTFPLDPADAGHIQQAVGMVDAFAGRIDGLVMTGPGADAPQDIITACLPLLRAGQGRVLCQTAGPELSGLPIAVTTVPPDAPADRLLSLIADA